MPILSSNVVDIEILKKSLKIFIDAKWGSLRGDPQ